MIIKKALKQWLDLSAMQKVWSSLSIIGFASFITLFGHRLSSGKTVHLIAPTSGIYYWLYWHVSYFMHLLLVNLAQFLPTKYHILWALILLTMMIYLVLLPLTIVRHQQIIKRQIIMNKLYPQLDIIDYFIKYERINQMQRKKIFALKKKIIKINHVPNFYSLLIINIVIQSFVMTALYQTISYSNDLSVLTIGSIKLAQHSPFLALIASLLTLTNMILTCLAYTEKERQTLDPLDFIIGPLSIFMSGFFLPSTIVIYWIIGRLVLICENYLIYYCFRPYLKKKYQTTENQTIIQLIKDKNDLKQQLAK